MKKYVLALDQGTTSSRCILFDKQGNICGMAQKEFEQIYPHAGILLCPVILCHKKGKGISKILHRHIRNRVNFDRDRKRCHNRCTKRID